MATRIQSKKSQATRSAQKGAAAKGAEKGAALEAEENIPSLDELTGSSSEPANYDAEAALETLEGLLSRSVTDPIVSDGDAHAAVQELRKVPSAEFKSVLSAMKDKGLLSTLNAEMTERDRGVLMGALVSKGAAGFVTPPSVSPLPGQDHATLRPLVKVSKAFSSEMREMADTYNEDAVGDYAKDRELYVNRFKEKVLSATSIEDMRAVGSPTRVLDVEGALMEVYKGEKYEDTSIPLGAKNFGYWVKGASLRPESDVGLMTGIRDKIQLLNNKRTDGEVWVNPELTIKYGAQSDLVGGQVGVKVGGEVSSAGEVKVDLRRVAAAKSALVSGEATKGLAYDSRDDSLKDVGSMKYETGLSEQEVDIKKNTETKILGVKIKSDGVTNEYETTLDPLALAKDFAFGALEREDPLHLDKPNKTLPHDVSGANLEIGMKHTPSEAEYEAKGAMTVGGAGFSIKVAIGVGMKGADSKSVRALELQQKFAHLGLGFFDPPPELKQNIEWSKLDPERREYYANNLSWNQSEWTRHQEKTRPVKLAIPFTAR